MPQLFLHIGTQKTGTSSIQSALSANRKVLLDHGFDYPEVEADDGNKVSHYNSFRGFFSVREDQQASTQRFVERAAASKHHLVLSAECLSAWPGRRDNEDMVALWRRKAEIVGTIRAAFPNHDATVIMYTRDERTFLQSLYQQSLKVKGWQDTPENWRFFMSREGHLTSYGEEINCWRTHFDEVRVINYDRIASSVKTFCTITGLPMLPDCRENVTH